MKETIIMKQKSKNIPHGISLSLAAIFLLAGTTACNLGGSPTQTEPAQAATTSEQPRVVSAEAFVVPVQQADLSFEVGGRVVTVDVEEGDTVTTGQRLVKLDDSSQQANIAQAKANLASAEASLADTKAGATAEQIAQSEASVAAAEAALAELLAGPTPEEIAQAEASVETAQANLAQVLAGSRDEDIQAAASKLLQTEAEVREAQADYDANVYGDLDRLGPYGLALEQATLSYESAKADYDKLINGATGEEIAVSRAQVYEAQTALDKVLAGATVEQIAQARAEVARTEAALAELKAGATVEQIAVAEAGVQTAEVGVTLAEVDLAQTELNAPFEGIVGMLNIDEGEMVGSGTTALSLADTSRWQIETDDLNEIDVVEVQEGANVQITVDALPGETYEGQVIRIRPKSETKAGDVTYTVLIDITQGDTSKLRWGMTTFVDIEVEPEL
jgi:HlyD family secretion protein